MTTRECDAVIVSVPFLFNTYDTSARARFQANRLGRGLEIKRRVKTQPWGLNFKRDAYMLIVCLHFERNILTCKRGVYKLNACLNVQRVFTI